MQSMIVARFLGAADLVLQSERDVGGVGNRQCSHVSMKAQILYHAHLFMTFSIEPECDPGEFRNLAKEPAHLSHIETMHAAPVKELGEHPDETELRCRTETACGYGGDGSSG